MLVKRYLVESMAGEVQTSGAARLIRETTSDHGKGEGTRGRALALDAVEAPADSSGLEGASVADKWADGSGSGIEAAD